jgi:hypothetical protein
MQEGEGERELSLHKNLLFTKGIDYHQKIVKFNQGGFLDQEHFYSLIIFM